jgi:hypothetical protein
MLASLNVFANFGKGATRRKYATRTRTMKM